MFKNFNSNNTKLNQYFNEVATIADLKEYCTALAEDVFELMSERYGLDDAVSSVSMLRDLKHFVKVVEEIIGEE